MQELQKAITLLTKVYVDAKTALGDGHLDGTEIFGLFMDAAPAANVQWKLIPGEVKALALADRISIITSLDASLPEDPAKSKIVNTFGALFFGIGIAQ